MKTETIITQCSCCKQQYENWPGSTPCCGALAFVVEDDKVTSKTFLFTSINNGPIKPEVIEFKK